MESYNIYYLPYSIEKKVDYTFIFYLYGIAEKDSKWGIKCIINYTTLGDLQKKINSKYSNGTNSVISVSTISRELKKSDYEVFFLIEDRPDGKRIKLNNNYVGVKGKSYVRLCPSIYKYLIKENNNLLSKYVIFLLYWCGIGNGKADFTEDQFLLSSGYKTSSISQKEKLCQFNKQLCDKGIITIQKNIVNGKYRNTYTIIPL